MSEKRKPCVGPMTELEDTIVLANKILDRISADPDDDLAMLSRQFLRSREEIERLTFEHGKMGDQRRQWMDKTIAARTEIERLKFLNGEERQTIDDLLKLLIRAADALSKGPFHPQYKLDLAKELRKAAE